MLKSLIISNYALIEDLQMHPGPSLNMITGETGAGKSIMLGGLGLLLGKRADTKVLLREDKKCVVEGWFEIESYGLQHFFETHELDYENPCIIRREISPSGKSRSFVNDSPVLLDVLKELGAKLVDVHSQHDTLLLGEGAYQLGLVDVFSASEQVLKSYQERYGAFRKAKREWEILQQKAIDLQKEADFNQFQLDELEEMGLQNGEQDELEAKQEILENAEEIKLKIREITGLGHQENFGLIQGLEQAQQSLQHLERLAHTFQSLRERFQSALIELKDVFNTLELEEQQVEVDFEKLEEIRERLGRILQLQKKHGVVSVEALIQLEKELADRVFEFQHVDENLQRAAVNFQEKEKQMLLEGAKLSQQRQACFSEFSTALEGLLHRLGMENARIIFDHYPIPPSQMGIDQVDILFTANKGSAPQSLRKVASGGEFSRLLFAIKYLMAERMAMPTLIFDEIDTGVSGEVALQMVRMMKTIATNHQVLCITHLPQVAAKGSMHYYVFKDNSTAKTISKIKLLEPDARVHELAKMIAGEQPSSSALASARELLAD